MPIQISMQPGLSCCKITCWSSVCEHVGFAGHFELNLTAARRQQFSYTLLNSNNNWKPWKIAVYGHNYLRRIMVNDAMQNMCRIYKGEKLWWNTALFLFFCCFFILIGAYYYRFKCDTPVLYVCIKNWSVFSQIGVDYDTIDLYRNSENLSQGICTCCN